MGKKRNRGGSTWHKKLFVYDAHGGMCGICNEPVDFRRRDENDPLSFTLDHIIPHCMGGGQDLDNMQPAHRVCNTHHGWDLQRQLHSGIGRH